jgi:hypothetical protein
VPDHVIVYCQKSTIIATVSTTYMWEGSSALQRDFSLWEHGGKSAVLTHGCNLPTLQQITSSYTRHFVRFSDLRDNAGFKFLQTCLNSVLLWKDVFKLM